MAPFPRDYRQDREGKNTYHITGTGYDQARVEGRNVSMLACFVSCLEDLGIPGHFGIETW